MVCPFCLYKRTTVYNSRPTTKINNVWRRRRCEHCKRTFSSTESVDPTSVLQVQDGKQLTPFWEVKLLLSVLRVCDHLEEPEVVAHQLIHTIMQKLYRQAAVAPKPIKKQDIAAITLATLKSYNLAAYIKYLSYHEPDIDNRSLKKELKKR